MNKNILVSINKNYIKHFLTMLNSLSSNNQKSIFNVYIMHSELDDKDKTYIDLHIHKNIKLNYIYMDSKLFEGFPIVKRYPYEIYYRILSPFILPKNIKKVLYLDSDSIIHNNIDSLYDLEFDGNLFIASTQIYGIMNWVNWINRIRLGVPKNYKYINTGVMMMNLEKLRNEVNIEKIIKYTQKFAWKMYLYDQDIIYKFFGNKVKIVSNLVYNLSDRWITIHNLSNKKFKIDRDWIEKNNVIIHYLGRNKPWKKNYRGILKEYYLKYNNFGYFLKNHIII